MNEALFALAGTLLGALIQYLTSTVSYMRQRKDEDRKLRVEKVTDTYYDAMCFIRESQKHCHADRVDTDKALEREPNITAKLRLYGSDRVNDLFVEYRDCLAPENYTHEKACETGLALEKQIAVAMRNPG